MQVCCVITYAPFGSPIELRFTCLNTLMGFSSDFRGGEVEHSVFQNANYIIKDEGFACRVCK